MDDQGRDLRLNLDRLSRIHQLGATLLDGMAAGLLAPCPQRANPQCCCHKVTRKLELLLLMLRSSRHGLDGACSVASNGISSYKWFANT